MPMTTKVENEHEQLVLMFKQFVDERERLLRENEYLKSKLNDSILIETIEEMKKERDLLLKLLSNLTRNNKNEQIKLLKQQNNVNILSTLNTIHSGQNSSSIINHRLKPQSIIAYRTDNEPSACSIIPKKHSQINRKHVIQQTPSTQELNKVIRKHDIQLKHSQNSPFQHYRSQSLQNLT